MGGGREGGGKVNTGKGGLRVSGYYVGLFCEIGAK